MKQRTIYLCGPINGRTDADARDWREHFKSLWPEATLDPMRRDYRGRELEPGIAQEIVQGDLQDIDSCQGFVVYFDKPSVGTAMEVFYAWTELGMPIVIVDAQPEPKPLSPWLLFHSSVVVKTIPEAVEWLKMHATGKF